jgi:hypothetical protein
VVRSGTKPKLWVSIGRSYRLFGQHLSDCIHINIYRVRVASRIGREALLTSTSVAITHHEVGQLGEVIRNKLGNRPQEPGSRQHYNDLEMMRRQLIAEHTILCIHR